MGEESAVPFVFDDASEPDDRATPLADEIEEAVGAPCAECGCRRRSPVVRRAWSRAWRCVIAVQCSDCGRTDSSATLRARAGDPVLDHA